MEILILSLVAGVFVVGGLWIASRNARPTEFRDEIGVLADSIKLAADGASSAVDDALGFVRSGKQFAHRRHGRRSATVACICGAYRSR